jgi:hypothetical protein
MEGRKLADEKNNSNEKKGETKWVVNRSNLRTLILVP